MNDKIGFIGNGQMAAALAGGFCSVGNVTQDRIAFFGTNPIRHDVLTKEFPNSTLCDSVEQLVADCDLVFLAVKPQVLESMMATWNPLLDSNRHLLVSLAPGISVSRLSTELGTERIVRVMPNTPCLVGQGASGICHNPAVSESEVELVCELLENVGLVVRVKESAMHGVTGLSGSGPAYVYMMIEALADGGVAAGLPRETALKLATQTLLGGATMVAQTGMHPGQLKDAVASPSGTTIAGIRSLEQSGLRGALIDAVSAAAKRSAELS
jgi:pyrroline-5-carboxylate reductase